MKGLIFSITGTFQNSIISKSSKEIGHSYFSILYSRSEYKINVDLFVLEKKQRIAFRENDYFQLSPTCFVPNFSS